MNELTIDDAASSFEANYRVMQGKIIGEVRI
jgi:hypothetical protein